MSMRIKLLPRVKIVVSVLSGTLSYDDLLEHRARIAADPRHGREYRLLLDSRRVDRYELDGNQIRTYANFAQPGDPRFARIAILVGDDLGYGMARIFQAYNARQDDNTLRIFRNGREAWRWLREPDDA